ncbi:MAG: hypothetical protein SOS94_04265 [Lachnospiraceae bacterium]|nr:hypothetical protein [Lachnospiraceae bacterium]
MSSYIHNYNFERCHSAIGNVTPASVYYPVVLKTDPLYFAMQKFTAIKYVYIFLGAQSNWLTSNSSLYNSFICSLTNSSVNEL